MALRFIFVLFALVFCMVTVFATPIVDEPAVRNAQAAMDATQTDNVLKITARRSRSSTQMTFVSRLHTNIAFALKWYVYL